MLSRHEKGQQSEQSSRDLSTFSTEDTNTNYIRNESNSKGDVARFVKKLVSFVDDPTTDHIVSWNEDGTAFVIWDSNEFCLKILSRHFRHTNLSSFVRQLNQYGFRKKSQFRWEFYHECFLRGRLELLNRIKRVTVSSSSVSKSSKDLLVASVPMTVDYSPSFALPFAFSASELQQEFLEMDKAEASLQPLQREANALLNRIEYVKSKCDELNMQPAPMATETELMEQGLPASSTVEANSLYDKKSNRDTLNTFAFSKTDMVNTPWPESSSQTSLPWKQIDMERIAERVSSLSQPSRFTSELVYRRWMQAQLQREIELFKSQGERDWQPDK
eukprot:jgi/Galph1/4699/GphlegSOOS_G3355.1